MCYIYTIGWSGIESLFLIVEWKIAFTYQVLFQRVNKTEQGKELKEKEWELKEKTEREGIGIEREGMGIERKLGV